MSLQVAILSEQHCFRSLHSLLSADGVNKSMITVFIDGFFDVSVHICRI